MFLGCILIQIYGEDKNEKKTVKEDHKKMRSDLSLVSDLSQTCPHDRTGAWRTAGGVLELFMELSELPFNTDKIQEGHIRCLKKAIDRLQYLLTQDAALQDYDQIHSAKSILYAAIEQMGMRGERIFTVQRMLRELLSIVTSQYQSPGHDRDIGVQILAELKARLPSI